MSLSNHNERSCLSLEPSIVGTKHSFIGGNVIDNEAKIILGRCPEAKFMLGEIEKYLQDRYSKVYDGTLNEIISVPETYDYGVETKKGKKAFAMQYGNEKEIEARIQQLQGAKKAEDVKERTHLEEILYEKRPLACEDKVNQRFLEFFKNEPGLYLHGFKPKEYLQRFRELAKHKRETISTLRLLDIEQCILELLGIEEQEIEDWVKEKIGIMEIKTKQLPANSSTSFIPGTIIWDTFQLNMPKSFPKDRKNQYSQFRSIFPMYEKCVRNGKQRDKIDANGVKIEKVYSLNEIRARLIESEFDLQVTFDDEYDLFFFLPNYKLILAGEVKQAMKNDANAVVANDKQAKSASHQLKKSERFIRKTFGNLLDQDWKYVKIAVLYDNNGTYITEKCSECSPFILTNSTEIEEMQQMQNLWKAISGKEYIGPTNQSNASGMNDLKHVFGRLVGLSGLTFIVQKIGKYHELMGTKSHETFDEGITAGWTRASPLCFGSEKEDIRFGDVIGRPADVYRLIFWNPDQRHILTGNLRFVIFCHDYGGGKSLLLKEGCIREADIIERTCKNEARNEEVEDPLTDETSQLYKMAYFISLVATTIKGFPAKEHYLYDVATEMELQGFRVKFLSTNDIKEFYKRHHPNFKEAKIDVYEAVHEVNIYDMTYFFISMHQGSSFFLDEVPFIYHLNGYYGSGVDKLETFLVDSQKAIKRGKLWVALQANQLSDQSSTASSGTEDNFEKTFIRMCFKLGKTFSIPTLSKNMRNSEKINKASRELKANDLQETIKKLTSPVTSIFQEDPTLIPVHKGDLESNFKDILSKILNPRKKTLILHSKAFKGNDLYLLVLKSFSEIKEENVLRHDRHPDCTSKEALQGFLKSSQKRIGIFQSVFVTGMESSNVIYFLNAHEGSHDAIRCPMTRAVSHLSIILEFENNPRFPQFKSTVLDHHFMRKCVKSMKKYDEGQICLTCDIEGICATCSIACHHEHQFAGRTYQFHDTAENKWKGKNALTECQCFKTNCLFHKSEIEEDCQPNTTKDDCTIC